MKRIATAAAAVVAAGLVAMPKAASAAVHHRIADCSSRGQFAVCTASGTARHHPLDIFVHVRATPRQGVMVAWSMTCVKGSSAGSKSGQFTTGTPINRKLRKPFRHPDSCIVAATAQLNRGGRLHTFLDYTN